MNDDGNQRYGRFVMLPPTTSTEISEEGKKLMEKAITQAKLLRLNRYALDEGLITREIYLKMEHSIRVHYDETMKRVEEQRKCT